MDTLDYKAKAHLLVCCRKREDKPCCSKKNAEELVSQLKEWVRSENLKKKIKVSKSSCLGFCESGITACLYPQNQWLHNISLRDLEKIKTMLKKHAE